jgi:hypothetical protein
MNAGAEDPDCGISSLALIEATAMMSICDHSSQKRLRGLDHMGKSDGPFSPSYRLEFARDRSANCDAFQKLG